MTCAMLPQISLFGSLDLGGGGNIKGGTKIICTNANTNTNTGANEVLLH